MRDTAAILWCAPEPPPFQAVAGLPVRPHALGAPHSGLALVLHRRAFDSLDALREAQAGFHGPSLWLVPEDELEAALRVLPEGTDCALSDTPTPLLAHRIRRLLGISAHDPLTGLLTRAAFVDVAQRQLASGGASLLFLDVDHFKRINDTHGHVVGDRILAQLGGILARFVAPSPVARVGGEEMVALLPATREVEASAEAESLRAAVEDATWPEGCAVTVSVGVASADSAAPLESLLRGADEALYAAKATGRNRVVHRAALAREAREQDSSVELMNFEHLTQVLTQRFSGLLARRSARVYEAAREQAETDGVTTLPNRRSFDRRFSTDFAGAWSERTPLSIALIDVDDFGVINKTCGWPTGDQVLRAIVDHLKEHVPSDGWLARYGGDELVLVLARGPEDARHIAEAMRSAVALADIESTRGEPLDVSISVGVATLGPDDGSPRVLLERASDALLSAKENR